MTRIVRWFCCSAFCTNNFRTRNPQGKSIKFYRLPCDPEVQAAYTRIVRTTGINWHSGHICAEHWSRGYRENSSADFPDVPIRASQLVALQKKLKQARAQLERKATKPAKRKVSSTSKCISKAEQRKSRFFRDVNRSIVLQSPYMQIRVKLFCLQRKRRKTFRFGFLSVTQPSHGLFAT